MHLHPVLSILFGLCIPLVQSGGANAAQQTGGAACVIAKQLGNSEAIEWITNANSVATAIQQAKTKLRNKGFKYLFPQANSPLSHGWVVVVKSRFTTLRGKKRNSYGCGFSNASAEKAEQSAVTDLQAYSWGWRDEFGYQVIHQAEY